MSARVTKLSSWPSASSTAKVNRTITALNLRSKVFRQLDGAGMVTSERYDFKGNLLNSARQLLADYKHEVDWSGTPELESEVYRTATTYDALNRATTVMTPDGSVAHPKYNEANLLESLSVNIRGSDDPTPFVTYINYNARGQRAIIEYGNGTISRYTYDPSTFRLTRLVPCRKHDDDRIQDLHYTFDPAGNVTSTRNDALETIYFRNHVVSPTAEYVYDATYRLSCAFGREHAGALSGPQNDTDDAP